MNERIRELAGKALDEAVPETWTTLSSEQLERVYEKFAELIVRECIASIENADNGFEDYRNQIEDGMRNHCIDLIKNKFGVEE